MKIAIKVTKENQNFSETFHKPDDFPFQAHGEEFNMLVTEAVKNSHIVEPDKVSAVAAISEL